MTGCCPGRAVLIEGRARRGVRGSLLVRGARTKVWAASMGWRTPGIFAGENSRLCRLPLWLLYGGPYMAVSLVPASSLDAVAMKSAGATFAHVAMVTGGTSGEDRRLARATTRMAATRLATVASLTMS